jgi:transcription elongation factor Elf1
MKLDSRGIAADLKCPGCNGDVYVAEYVFDLFKHATSFRCVGLPPTPGTSPYAPKAGCRKKLGYVTRPLVERDTSLLENIQEKLKQLYDRRTNPPVLVRDLRCPKCGKDDVAAVEQIGYDLLKKPNSRSMTVDFKCDTCGHLCRMHGERNVPRLEAAMQETLDFYFRQPRTTFDDER